MHVLIIYAHPEPTSFTAALKDSAVRAFSATGHQVEVSDLYGEGFNPVAGRHDFLQAADPTRASTTNRSSSTRVEPTASPLSSSASRTRMVRADLLVFVFPLWWGGLPAIVKGWFDRVCAYGVAYAKPSGRACRGLGENRGGVPLIRMGWLNDADHLTGSGNSSAPPALCRHRADRADAASA
jgi:putative NADPH-quinone reductase